MTKPTADGPMTGVRVLEVAQFTYTPSAGAVLSDWGADVVKVEHAVTGDAQRGMRGLSGFKENNYHPIMEHPNRNKRSVGLALEHPEALEALYKLAATSDVFLTNFLPDARERLQIDVDDIRQLVVAGHAAPWDGEAGLFQQRLGVENACDLARRFASSGIEVVIADVVTVQTAELYRTRLPSVLIVHLRISLAEARRRATQRPVYLTEDEFESARRHLLAG